MVSMNNSNQIISKSYK